MDFASLNRSAVAAAQPLLDLIPKYLPARLTSASWKSYVIPVILSYVLLVNSLRFQREKALRRKYKYYTRESMAKMTVDEAQGIIKTLAAFEFPQLHLLALQFGLFKTYGVETISKLLLATRNLTDPVNSLKRYEDTAVLIGEFMINTPSSERTNRAIARMNFLHSKYIASGQISNADLLYTLSVFVTEPPRFMKQFEWRAMNEMEYCAYGVFWKSIGDAMGIQYKGYLAHDNWKDGIEFFEDISAWAKAYEVIAFKPSPVNNKPANALIPMITYWVPRPLKAFAQESVCVLMGDRVREAFMLPEPGILPASLVYTALVVRRFYMRHLALPRLIEQKRLHDPDPKTGRMNIVSSFGNYPFYVKPTVWNRWGPEAWGLWLLGAKVPGDNPKEYMPEGYLWTDIGPWNRQGMGADEMQADAEKLMGAGRGGCPFG